MNKEEFLKKYFPYANSNEWAERVIDALDVLYIYYGDNSTLVEQIMKDFCPIADDLYNHFHKNVDKSN